MTHGDPVGLREAEERERNDPGDGAVRLDRGLLMELARPAEEISREFVSALR